jgi:DNA invertase Pin-like site-specific DNA recombinase
VKVGIYARYSSDNQRDASIADQLRICRAFAERQGWTIAHEYSDHAVSGATLLRPGFQSLTRDALNRRFDVVLAESLDRFSRDQEDTAGLFKRLTFAGVNIVTLAEGNITHLHIGFKGTMNALFLKDLAEKTHRGLRGRIEDGKSAGGLCYGYRVVKTISGGSALAEALEHPETRTEASEALRDLIDAIILTPPPSRAGDDSRSGEPRLQIELKGNLAAMLGPAQNAKRSPETGDLSLQVVMVAGARSQLYLEFCWAAA